jgi:hypothetical protein
MLLLEYVDETITNLETALSEFIDEEELRNLKLLKGSLISRIKDDFEKLRNASET